MSENASHNGGYIITLTTMTPMSRSRAPQIAPLRAIVTLVALLAVFLQGFVVQTHVHAFSPLAGYEQSADAAHADAAHVDATNHQAACVVCQALAASGRAALPQAPALIASVSLTHETTARAIPEAPRTRAHAWQSRAPPVAL